MRETLVSRDNLVSVEISQNVYHRQSGQWRHVTADWFLPPSIPSISTIIPYFICHTCTTTNKTICHKLVAHQHFLLSTGSFQTRMDVACTTCTSQLNRQSRSLFQYAEQDAIILKRPSTPNLKSVWDAVPSLIVSLHFYPCLFVIFCDTHTAHFRTANKTMRFFFSETSCIDANPWLRLATIQRHKIKRWQGYMLNSSERCKSHPNSYSNSRYYKPSTWIMSMMHYVTFPILTPTARKKSIFNEALPTKISDCWGYERTQIRISASPHDRR